MTDQPRNIVTQVGDSFCLSMYFLIDAHSTDDARRQLMDTIQSAGRMLAGLGGPLDAPGPASPPKGLLQVMSDEQAAQVREHGHLTGYQPPAGSLGDLAKFAQGGPIPRPRRPWDDDPRGMGE